MVTGTKVEGEVDQVVPLLLRKTIHSIREIVSNHSDADIYAALKDSNMDPNETTQKLLNQDPFHEVKKKRDKRKELTGYDLSVTPRAQAEISRLENSNKSMPINAHRGGLIRSSVPDSNINKEFRVVRDNRVGQSLKEDTKLDSLMQSHGNEPLNLNFFEKRSTRILTDQNFSNSSIFDGHGVSSNLKPPFLQVSDLENDFCEPSGYGVLSTKDIMMTSQSLKLDPERVSLISSAVNSSSASTSSVIGVYSSSSDPVHVPSPASKSAGTVGAIRREVGAIGVRKQFCNVQPTDSAVSNNSHSATFGGEATSISKNVPKVLVKSIKDSQHNQVSTPEAFVSSTTNRRMAGVPNNFKHVQNFNHQRALQPNMEWKPKSQKPKTTNSTANEPSSFHLSSNENDLNSSLDNTIDLSNMPLHANIHREKHVIIPQRLRVPEAECINFTFGSFGDVSDSNRQFISTKETIGSAVQSEVTPVSNSASVPGGPNEESSTEVGHFVDYQTGTSRTTSPPSAEELERSSTGNNEPLNPQNIESYADIGLVQSHSPPYSSHQPERLYEIPRISNFSPYETEASYVTPFFQTSLDDNVRGHCLASPPEILNLHAANITPLTTTSISQQQQASQQHQQALTQIYPQVHISHYPNFMPYRHILSPVYVPPMAMPSYSNNSAYAHPSAGNSYLIMPGGSSHLPTGGMKYAPSQYKPFPAGSSTAYGNYSTPAAYAIGTPSPVGGPTTLEDMTRIKFKDNNLYAPNQQAEPSDLWMHTPRELTGLQSTPYYSLSGHAAHPAAFVSAHAHAATAAAASGHASFSGVAVAAQPSPMQYPGMYHTPQPASMAAPHHLVHQQVSPPVGVAAGAQVGGFQQPQLSRLNWTANF